MPPEIQSVDGRVKPGHDEGGECKTEFHARRIGLKRKRPPRRHKEREEEEEEMNHDDTTTQRRK
jgi:hypothetical protein